MTKFFILGATGYVGGTVLNALLAAHPDAEITALVRTASKGELVTKAYPSVKYVIGDLDSSDVITAASAEADIVLSIADADHEGQIKAIYAGLAKNPNITYLIHTSGTGLFVDVSGTHAGQKSQSEISDKTWDDVADIDRITTLPLEQIHRPIDVLVENPPNDRIRAAIICPPAIYGVGTGPGNRRTILFPVAAKATIERKEAFALPPGESEWSSIHILDVADLYILLINEALKTDGSGGKVPWGKEAFYFAENGTLIASGDIARKFGEAAYEKGLIPSAEVKWYTKEQVQAIHPWGVILWGSNSKSRATRARTTLGWNPTRPRLLDTLAEEIENAASQIA